MQTSLSIFNMLTILSLLSLLHLITANKPTFCYEKDECGPKSSQWPSMCQKGRRQSPVNLPLSVATIGSSKMNGRALDFIGYKESYFHIRNTGYDIRVSFAPNLNSSFVMSGYQLEDKFVFAQMHFHWGRSILEGGSEHTINRQRYPMEVHLVHYNSKYTSLEKASRVESDPNALAVLGMFLYSVPVSQTNGIHQISSAFTIIADNLPTNYQTVEESSVVKGTLDFSQFLPKVGDTIYRYNGSLTTPGCAQIVSWSVVPEPILVRREDYMKFMKVLNVEGSPMGINYRPLQPVFDRRLEIFHKVK